MAVIRSTCFCVIIMMETDTVRLDSNCDTRMNSSVDVVAITPA